jgi:hypothetical protein
LILVQIVLAIGGQPVDPFGKRLAGQQRKGRAV